MRPIVLVPLNRFLVTHAQDQSSPIAACCIGGVFRIYPNMDFPGLPASTDRKFEYRKSTASQMTPFSSDEGAIVCPFKCPPAEIYKATLRCGGR